MIFLIEDRRFELKVAGYTSSANGKGWELRDGLAWELWEYVAGEWVMLLEVFRQDFTDKCTFEVFSMLNIPVAALKVLLDDFDKRRVGMTINR